MGAADAGAGGGGPASEALEAYGQARQVIADELGTDPGGELQRLYAELLAADVSTPPSRARPRRRRPAARAAAGAPDVSADALLVRYPEATQETRRR